MTQTVTLYRAELPDTAEFYFGPFSQDDNRQTCVGIVGLKAGGRPLVAHYWRHRPGDGLVRPAIEVYRKQIWSRVISAEVPREVRDGLQIVSLKYARRPSLEDVRWWRATAADDVDEQAYLAMMSDGVQQHHAQRSRELKLTFFVVVVLVVVGMLRSFFGV